MSAPLTMAQAEARGLLVPERGIYTFSNGSEWDSWASGNCFACRYYDEDTAGRDCAFDSAAFLGMVSPDLARLFGWIQEAEWDRPDDHRDGWDAPQTCACFRAKRDDDNTDPPPPPEPDPRQLVLIADPSEDIGQVATCDPAVYPELVG